MSDVLRHGRVRDVRRKIVLIQQIRSGDRIAVLVCREDRKTASVVILQGKCRIEQADAGNFIGNHIDLIRCVVFRELIFPLKKIQKTCGLVPAGASTEQSDLIGIEPIVFRMEPKPANGSLHVQKRNGHFIRIAAVAEHKRGDASLVELLGKEVGFCRIGFRDVAGVNITAPGNDDDRPVRPFYRERHDSRNISIGLGRNAGFDILQPGQRIDLFLTVDIDGAGIFAHRDEALFEIVLQRGVKIDFHIVEFASIAVPGDGLSPNGNACVVPVFCARRLLSGRLRRSVGIGKDRDQRDDEEQ